MVGISEGDCSIEDWKLVKRLLRKNDLQFSVHQNWYFTFLGDSGIVASVSMRPWLFTSKKEFSKYRYR